MAHPAWARVRDGKTVVCIGDPPDDGPDDFLVIRVDADASATTWGPLQEARRRIEEVLGQPTPAWPDRFDTMGTSALTRFLGDLPEPSAEAGFIRAANALFDQTDGRAVVVFESLDHADATTLQGLTEITSRTDRLRLPLVLHFDERPAEGAGAELVAAVGDAGVAARDTAAEDEPAFDWDGLAVGPRFVLRAAAVIGRTFDAALVAALLDANEGEVLEALQLAADEGAPLADRGGGRFSLPARGREALLRRLLPSVAEHWHRRLAELLADVIAEPGDAGVAPPLAPPSPGEPVEPAEPAAGYASLLEDAGPDVATPAPDETGLPTAATAAEEPAPEPIDDALPAGDPSTELRAARHRLAVRDVETAVEHYCRAIRGVAAAGDSRRALGLADDILARLQRFTGHRRTELVARVMLEAAAIQWHGAGFGPNLTLPGALHTAQRAREVLGDDGPVELRADLASVIAGICYDLGDVKSLERAIAELTGASRLWIDAGRSDRAARLLNDQAAVYLRAGDPVRATHLLERSREIYDRLRRRRPDDPVVILERAQTEHLLARLPLHAALREGREDDAYSLALGHARAAERGYEAIGRGREVGRIRETMGRLELARGRLEPAAAHLREALTRQNDEGDVTGLARTTAAIADLSIANNDPEHALSFLSDSIALNMDKGSPVGLAFNRRALDRLEDAFGGPEPDPAFAATVGRLREGLEHAESVLGRVELPPHA